MRKTGEVQYEISRGRLHVQCTGFLRSWMPQATEPYTALFTSRQHCVCRHYADRGEYREGIIQAENKHATCISIYPTFWNGVWLMEWKKSIVFNAGPRKTIWQPRFYYMTRQRSSASPVSRRVCIWPQPEVDIVICLSGHQRTPPLVGMLDDCQSLVNTSRLLLPNEQNIRRDVQFKIQQDEEVC